MFHRRLQQATLTARALRTTDHDILDTFFIYRILPTTSKGQPQGWKTNYHSAAFVHPASLRPMSYGHVKRDGKRPRR